MIIDNDDIIMMLPSDRRSIVAPDLSLKSKVFSNNTSNMNAYIEQILIEGWRMHVVDQNRGRCYYRSKEITLPVWAMRKSVEYKLWYISHEVSHAFAGHRAHHGPMFMQWLKTICPLESQAHELGYKPKNAILSGIGCFDF